MSMLTLTSAVEKRLPDSNSLNLLDGASQTHTGRGRKTPTLVPILRQPQSVPVKGVSQPIEVKFASTDSEWEQAFKLVATSYQARGYEAAGSHHLRFISHHALPDTATIVAKKGERVVGTFSIVLDNTLLGLPMESLYSNEITSLRRAGRRILEFTTLADADLRVVEFLPMFITLIKVGMQYHVSQGGDTFAMAVNPRHKKFYTKKLGFLTLGPCRAYEAVQGHPAEAFWVDPDTMRENAPDMHEELFGCPLPLEALHAPRIPPYLSREFCQQSSQCDPQEVEKILAWTERHGSTRRW
jgi:hypothetical protein